LPNTDTNISWLAGMPCDARQPDTGGTRSPSIGQGPAPDPMKDMKNRYSKIIIGTIIFVWMLFTAVCWHSITEIHYLKSFFPTQFSVQDAYYASAVELIKVVIIGIPIVVIIAVGLNLLGRSEKD